MLFLLLLACGTGKDLDGDGVPDAADCAPDNGAISPDAVEACNGLDDDCDGVVDQGLPTTVWYPDIDGDGWGDAAEAVEACAAPAGFVEFYDDCDDADPWTHPFAVEVCDGVDQDCSGVADDDAVDARWWYPDADEDGWGVVEGAVLACDAAPGTTPELGDCDDADAGRSPGATEACGGGDDDCDDLVDLDDPDLAADPFSGGAQAGFVDADGDGWGDAAGVFCPEAAEGWVADDGDCDDADPTSHPGAEPDCDDPVDHDCDGRPDDFDADGDGHPACTDCDDADDAVHPGAVERCNEVDDNCDDEVDNDADEATVWYRDSDRDGYGDPAASVRSCEAIRGYTTDGTDCDDAVDNVNPGAPENCRTAGDDNCDGLLDEIDATNCDDWYIDADGDGYGDNRRTVCQCTDPGAPYTTSSGGDCDEADPNIHPAHADPCGDGVDSDCDADDHCDADALDVVAWGPTDGSYAGYTVTTDADVTGDGTADLVVGTWGLERTTSAALVYAGPITTGGMTLTAELIGVGDDNRIGQLTQAADADGDGIGDVLVGSSNGDYGGVSGSGVVYLFTGPISGSMDSTAATFVAPGDRNDALGWGASIRHDLDGDATPDLVAGGLIGSYGGYCGWPGDSTGVGSIAGAAWCVLGDAHTGLLGHALDTGDVDGDGVPDLVYGMYSVGDGAVAWMAGPVSGMVSAAGFEGAFVLDDPDESSWGTGHRVLDDIDGDGLPDLAASGNSDTWYFGALPRGITGTTAGAAALFPDTRYYDESTPVAGVDLDDDGQRELVLGAPDMGEGAVMVYAHPVSGTLGPMDALVGFAGGAMGSGVARVPDLDGDGRLDVLVGAYYADNLTGATTGGVYLLPGSVLP